MAMGNSLSAIDLEAREIATAAGDRAIGPLGPGEAGIGETGNGEAGDRDAPVARVRFLQSATSPAWVAQAIAHPDAILLDHAQCERKAAGVALQLMAQYPTRADLVRQLTAIAREELDHFEQVNRWLDRRGIPLRALPPPPYGARLRSQVRRQEPGRLLDSLLVAGIIEARSHERLGLLAAHCPDEELAAFYRGLMASEARHYGVYWVLADRHSGREATTARLGELAAVEREVLATLHPEPRVHS